MAFGFGEECFELGVADRIQQAEPGEMPFHAELAGRGGEEKDAGRGGGEGFDELVFGTRLGRTPAQVVRFVHHEKIPTGFARLRRSGGISREEIDRANHELAVEEGIHAGGVERGAPFLVENRKCHLEPPEHFDEPLVDERGRKKNQDACRTAGQVQALQHEAGLNGFPEPHFVGEQDPRSQSGSHFGSDRDLVGDEVDAAAGKSPGGILSQGAPAVQALGAQPEALQFIGLPREQPLLGF